MSYVESNLTNNESVIYTAKMHWIVYLKGIGVLILGVLMVLTKDVRIMGLMVIVISIGFFFVAWLEVVTTELAVTSKRIIAKIGFIRRNTIELNHSKVESLSVNQTIMGRILNYGTIVVNGTGGNRLPVAKISNPLEFRRKSNIDDSN